MLESAIDLNRTEAVDYLSRDEKKSWDKGASSVATSTAAKWGNLPMLRQFMEEGLKADESTTESAAYGGSVECLQYLYEQNCPWDKRLFVGAARRGNLDCVTFAHGKGCPWDANATLAAAAGGQLLCLEYLISKGCPIHDDACSNACAGQHLPCVQLLIDCGAPWSSETAAAAANGNSIACLQALHVNGCPWDKYVTKQAAIRGNAEILRYSQDMGCTINGDIVRLAAASRVDDHACVQYAVEDLVMYMHEDGSTFGAAFKRGNVDCIEYLLNVFCPYMDYEFAGADPDPSLTHCEWDARFKSCIQCAVERGWQVNAELVRYVGNEKLLDCEAYLRSEGLYDI